MSNQLTKLQRKLLKYIIKNPNILFDTLQKHFSLLKNDLIDNLTILRDLGYLEKDSNFRGFIYPTIQGKSYFELCFKEWLYNNFLAIIDLIIALFGVIVAFIALFK